MDLFPRQALLSSRRLNHSKHRLPLISETVHAQDEKTDRARYSKTRESAIRRWYNSSHAIAHLGHISLQYGASGQTDTLRNTSS